MESKSGHRTGLDNVCHIWHTTKGRGTKMSSKRNMKGKTPKARLLDHDTSATLSNPNLVFKTFMECLKEGDAESAREVLAASLRHLNKSHLARRYDIPRRTA